MQQSDAEDVGVQASGLKPDDESASLQVMHARICPSAKTCDVSSCLGERLLWQFHELPTKHTALFECTEKNKSLNLFVFYWHENELDWTLTCIFNVNISFSILYISYNVTLQVI